jgi:hypothetical protein
VEPYGDTVLRDDLAEVGVFHLKHPYFALITATMRADGTLNVSSLPAEAVKVWGKGDFNKGAARILSILVESDTCQYGILPDPEDQ